MKHSKADHLMFHYTINNIQNNKVVTIPDLLKSIVGNKGEILCNGRFQTITSEANVIELRAHS
jgi:hypothetical protein